MIHHHQMLRAKRNLDSQTLAPTASPTPIQQWFTSIPGLSTIIIVGGAIVIFIIVLSVCLSIQQKQYQEKRKREAETKRNGIRTKLQPPKGKRKLSRIPPPPLSPVSSSNRRTDPTIDLFYARQEEFKSNSELIVYPHKTVHESKPPPTDDIPEPLMIPSLSLPAIRKGKYNGSARNSPENITVRRDMKKNNTSNSPSSLLFPDRTVAEMGPAR